MLLSKGKVILMIILIALIGFSIFNQINARRYGRLDCEKFDTANISDKISMVDVWDKQVKFKLQNNKEYVFSPYVNEKDNNDKQENYKNFLHFAEKGDSVVKPAYSDKLYLIKNGKKYVYRFTIIAY